MQCVDTLAACRLANTFSPLNQQSDKDKGSRETFCSFLKSFEAPKMLQLSRPCIFHISLSCQLLLSTVFTFSSVPSSDCAIAESAP